MADIEFLLRSVRPIVFDFDEVIVLGSDTVKRAAWPHVFASYGDAYKAPLEKAQAEQGGGRGGDRFTMMAAVFRALGVPEAQIDADVAKGAKVFDDFVQAGILKIGILPETWETLVGLAKTHPLYINTATPLVAFQTTYRALRLDTVCRGAYGRPNDKVQNFKLIAAREGVRPDQILFIGDGKTDLEAAHKFGCKFLGFATAENQWAMQTECTAISQVGQLNLMRRAA